MKSREDYDEYLASPHWAAKRLEALMHYGHACQMCGIPRNLDVHHVTYKRRGAELLADLRILCRPCHYSIHEAVATIAGGNRTHPKHLRRVTDAAIFNATRWRPPPAESAPKKRKQKQKRKQGPRTRNRRYTPEQKQGRRAIRREQGGPLSAADQLALDEARRLDDLERARTTWRATKGLGDQKDARIGTPGLGGRWGA